ncbi:hypothetical protein [Cohnella sp. AR92]|uniref:hypothetical protein n=1 Tax=Cohnella sp. AR92 TaxID=648716 RepID=UPI000F8E43F6|nr:hypothetical protein [Cohnella sp. AR92]RUS45534.1 hypothetical protein ELR57_19475 [Cohnella sp. AR92]
MNEPVSSTVATPSSKRKNAEVFSFLESLIEKKEAEIGEIEQMVDRYERRVQREEQAYRTMSPLRRMLTGRKPDHHLAVEYIHYVKKPKERVRLLREEVERLQAMIEGTLPVTLSE